MNRFLDSLAKLLSGVASPFVVIPATAAVVVRHEAPSNFGSLWTPFTFGTVGIPLLYIATLVKLGRITDLHVERREQRGGPFLVGTLGAAATASYLLAVHAPRGLLAFALALVTNGLIYFVVSRTWKVSGHAGGVVGAAVVLATLVGPGWWIALLLFPFVAWSRVRRKKHDSLQTIVAALLTGAATYAVIAAVRP